MHVFSAYRDPFDSPSRRACTILAAILVAALLLFVACSVAVAAPVAPGEVTLTQPNGVSFKAMPFGDEWYNGYEHQGYTILKDDSTGYWYYAGPAGHGDLVSTDRRAGIDDPPEVSQHLRERQEDLLRSPNLHPKGPESWPGVSGSHPVLLLLVDFTPSTSLGTTAAQWHAALFDHGAGAKSMKNYYEQASYGVFTVDPAAEFQGAANDGVVTVTLGYAHPNTAGNTGDANRQIVRNALIAADPYVDYGDFDVNGDGAIGVTELHLIVIARGFETSNGGPGVACSPSVWGHRWLLGGTVLPPVLDGVTLAGAAGGGGYVQYGEWHEQTSQGCTSSSGNMATIGIMAHEVGHDINWPDLYDTDQSSEGVGMWSIMGAGGWARVAGEPKGATPVLPDAFSKAYQHWLTPQQVTGTATGVAIANSAQNAAVYQLLDNANGIDWHFGANSGTGEYFLVENRQQIGFDAGLQDISASAAGCLIWHIDETRPYDNAANANEARKLVDVEEANGVQDLDANTNRGDAGDPWPGSTGHTAFNAGSTPNSYLYSGAASNVSVVNISTAGTGCTVDMLVAPPSPTPTTTPGGSGVLVNGDFEAGRNVGWSEYSALGYELVTQGTAHGGAWRAWLGGANGEVSEIAQVVTVPASGGAVNYWYRSYSSDICGYDFGYVKVNNTT